MAATLREADALLTAEDARFDAVVLGVAMPNGQGHGYCTRLRQLGHKMPVIIVADSGDEADIVRALHVRLRDGIRKDGKISVVGARAEAESHVCR
jgi:DNA-binding response OmpR family regulator